MAITAAPTSRPSRWPWIVLGVTAAFAAVGLVFVSLNGYSLLGDATNFIAFMGMGIVGALSLSRAPDNRIGWLLLWVAITVGAAFTTGEASIYAAAHGEHALAAWLAWPGNTLWTLGLFPLLILLPLVFPDGRLPSPRWRWLAWAGVGISFLAFVTIGFGDATFDVGDVGPPVTVANPLHVPWLDLLGPLEIRDLAAAPRPLRGGGRVDGHPIPPVERRRTTAAQMVRVRGRRARHLLRDQRDPRGPRHLRGSGGRVHLGPGLPRYPCGRRDRDPAVPPVGSGCRREEGARRRARSWCWPWRCTRARSRLFGVVGCRPPESTGTPVRDRARPRDRVPTRRCAWPRVADRLVYGRRATPYEVLTEFSERVGTSYATEDVLPRMAQVLGEGAGAEVARVWLRSGRELRQAAAWPADAPSIPSRSPVPRRVHRASRAKPPSRSATGESSSARSPSGCRPPTR